MTDQQRLFRLGEVQRLRAKRSPVVTQFNGLPGMAVTLLYAARKAGQHVIGKFAFYGRFRQNQLDKLFKINGFAAIFIACHSHCRELILMVLRRGEITQRNADCLRVGER